ncbi:ABC transporter permease subunit [Eubacteriales bacterium OttesenSCG-928-A19]|nr:ABC transporter permease subunit [Eubacteriales bacterium OttesenSCG-928-A19]
MNGMTTKAAQLGPQKTLWERIKTSLVRDRFLHLMVLPCVIWLLLFKYTPMAGLVIAFKNYRGNTTGFAGIFQAPWIGVRNFESFFKSIYFTRLMSNTLMISFLRLIFAFPASIIFALLLNEIRQLRFKKIVQTVSYMPHFLSWVVISALVRALLSPDAGAVNGLLQLLGHEKIFFLASEKWFRPVLVISGIWQGIGWGSIVYLAAISGLPQEQYESARLDGASKMKQIWYITLPGIKDIIAIMLIMQVGRAMTDNFEQIFNLYSPAVYNVADIFDTYVYRVGITDANFSYSAAVGLFKSVCSLILVLATNTITNKLDAGGLW